MKWTVESRLTHLGYDFGPLERTAIGIDARLSLIYEHIDNPDFKIRKNIEKTRVYYDEEVKFLDMAIANMIKRSEANKHLNEMRRLFKHWGKGRASENR